MILRFRITPLNRALITLFEIGSHSIKLADILLFNNKSTPSPCSSSAFGLPEYRNSMLFGVLNFPNSFHRTSLIPSISNLYFSITAEAWCSFPAWYNIHTFHKPIFIFLFGPTVVIKRAVRILLCFVSLDSI